MPLLLTTEQRQWLQDKGIKKKSEPSKRGVSKPGSSLKMAQEQSEARQSRKGSSVKMRAEPAAATADYAEPDRYHILLA